MANEPLTYRRLPGRGRGAIENVSLYLGPDHLLQVASSGFTESYRRFYFRDIQAISLRASLHGKVWNAIWGFLAFVPAVIGLQVANPAALVWWSVACVFFLLLIINIARGPTCACQIRTAVQARALPSLNRLRRSSKVIAQLRPLIEAAQGTLPPEDLARLIDEASRGPASAFATPAGPIGSPPVS